VAGHTPMIEQYLEIKNQYQDAILMFRLGDFYEMFFDDAKIASQELEIVLTSRDGGCSKVPMCGVPYHAVNNYISRLINKGHKVAICDQVEDPKAAKGIVKREVTKVITPGTVMDELMLDEGCNNYLAAVVSENDIIGLSFVDISTGDFFVSEFNGRGARDKLETELHRLAPSECLLPRSNSLDFSFEDCSNRNNFVITRIEESDLVLERAEQLLKKHFAVASLEGFGLKGFTSGVKAAGAILAFLYQTQKGNLKHIQSLRIYNAGDFMEMDYATRRNLELTSTIRDGKKEGSLLAILDNCLTAMGKRTLRRWIEQPLIDIDNINLRLDAIQELKDNPGLQSRVSKLMAKISDLERLAGKIGSEMAHPRDLLAIKNSLAVLPELSDLLADCSSKLLNDIANMDTLGEVFELIDQAIDEEAPLTIKEGGIIKKGYDGEVDELKLLSRDGTDWLLELESRERERTGIKNLKIGYNKVFGYYIEISKANLGLVPPDYIRKQTLVNTERFITEELKKFEEKILGAREKLYQREYELFCNLRRELAAHIGRLQTTAHIIATLDVFYSLAAVAYRYDYIRPVITANGIINIRAGRHPVVENSLPDSRFIPNDTHLSLNEHSFAIITGPNMGGKSTYMRQTALLVLMAQMGSFVPASSAEIGIVDRIFTRVGASDDLAAGQSTFMVEMTEVANILNNATRNSLVILDEIGRGTSTYDGLSIAQAVSEYIHDKIHARTLFATHYHELTAMAEARPGMFNLCVSVNDSGETVVFLKKVIPGKADKSYGIHVAQLAGLPAGVIERSRELLDTLEKTTDQKPPTVTQINLFSEEMHPVVEELRALDVDELTPREALRLLYQWKESV
jgi:DNA mismatch repair protein MutS